MEIKRKKFQGVLNILSFNRHFYLVGLTALLLIIASYLMFNLSDLLFWIIMFAFIYGFTAPLIVSAYIYDFSGYYNFTWLENCGITDSIANEILNINAGFDETSFIIKRILPLSDLKVFDFYNAERHTERAIVRARKVSLSFPNTQQIATDSIPLKDESIDIIFLLSAVHEIRSTEEKIKFLKECYRICKPDGKVIMVEHLRDFSNFLAFSVGFTHFFSKTTWKRSFDKAGFSVFSETKFTPFMSIFKCCP